MKGLSGKVGMVTGAGSGLGRETVVRLAADGARVLAVDVSGAQIETAQLAGGDTVSPCHADVTNEAEVAAAVDRAVSELGGLDFVCNIAGIDGPAAATAEVAVEDFDRVMAVNARGVFLGMKHGLRAMTEAGTAGAIVNMASAAGRIGVPFATAYCASKGAVIQMTKSAAREYGGAGIRLNAVAPGLIDSGMGSRALAELGELAGVAVAATALGRAGTGGDVASLVAYLVSDEAWYITGQVLGVDGGWVA